MTTLLRNPPKPSVGIAALVKTPGLSPVKTRLAKTIGNHQAELIYHRLLQCTKNLLNQTQSDLSFQPYWAIAEPNAIHHKLWTSFSTLYQGEGGLGPRLSRIYSTLLEAHDIALLIGADSPELNCEVLSQAHAALRCHPWVVGPTLDGGFYLFGGSRPLTDLFWTKIPYSVDTTLRHLLAELPQNESVHQLEPLADIDTERDLAEIAVRRPDLFMDLYNPSKLG